MSPIAPRYERIGLALIAAAGVLILWLPALTRSFWLDETGTSWVVKNGLADAVDRSRYQGQTPLYYVIAWLARRALGSGEAALRMPSLLAAVICVYLVYRLGKRLFDADAGALAAVIVATFGSIAFAATDARPYALALAALAASSLALVRWLDTGETLAAVAWVVCTALAMALSYTFVLGLLPQAVYALIRLRGGSPVRLRTVLLACAGVAIMLAPAVPHLLDLLRQEGLLTWQGDISRQRIVKALAPTPIVAGLAVAIVFGRTGPGRILRTLSRRWQALAFTAMWAYVPTLIMLAAGLLVSGKFFQTRYHIAAALGFALLGARLIGTVGSPAARLLAALAIFAVGFGTVDNGIPEHRWREAAAAINTHAEQTTPVLLHAGLSTRRSATEDPGGELLIAPAIAYDVEGEVISLPFNIEPENEPALAGIADQIDGADRFLVVVSFDIADFVTWFEDRLAPARYEITAVFESRQLAVTLFERRP